MKNKSHNIILRIEKYSKYNSDSVVQEVIIISHSAFEYDVRSIKANYKGIERLEKQRSDNSDSSNSQIIL